MRHIKYLTFVYLILGYVCTNAAHATNPQINCSLINMDFNSTVTSGARGDEQAILARFKVQIRGLAGKNCTVHVYVKNDRGEFHKGRDGKPIKVYWDEYVPSDPHTISNNICWFTYYQLNPFYGTHKYEYVAYIKYNGEWFGPASISTFQMTGTEPTSTYSATINNSTTSSQSSNNEESITYVSNGYYDPQRNEWDSANSTVYLTVKYNNGYLTMNGIRYNLQQKNSDGSFIYVPVQRTTTSGMYLVVSSNRASVNVVDENMFIGPGYLYIANYIFSGRGDIAEKIANEYRSVGSDRNSSSSRSSNRNAQSKANCSYCHGTGYFLTQSSNPGTFIGHSPYYNSGGNKCRICGALNQHWHLECKHP